MLAHDGLDDFFDEAGGAFRNELFEFAIFSGEAGRNFDLDEGVVHFIHCIEVHFHYVFASAAIGFANGIFDEGDGFVSLQNAGDEEESSLHGGVDSSAETNFFSDLESIDVIEFDLAIDDGFLHVASEAGEGFFTAPIGVQEEYAVFLDAAEEVKSADESRVVTGNKVFLANQILAVDGLFAKAQVAARDSAALLAVILEISLSIHFGVVADDDDAILVCANCSV